MKPTRVEDAVMQVLRMRGVELTSVELYETLKPVALGRIHRVLDHLLEQGLIGQRREDEKRIVWSVK